MTLAQIAGDVAPFAARGYVCEQFRIAQPVQLRSARLGTSPLPTKLAEIAQFLAPYGLATRGALKLADDELSTPQIGRARTLVLIGSIGPSGWQVFAHSPELRDGLANPLDRWSRRVIGALAAACGGAPIYPFDGPPYRPF